MEEYGIQSKRCAYSQMLLTLPPGFTDGPFSNYSRKAELLPPVDQSGRGLVGNDSPQRNVICPTSISRHVPKRLAMPFAVIVYTCTSERLLLSGEADKAELELFEVFCNPNSATSAFTARALISLKTRDGVRVTTEGSLSALKEDLDSFLSQTS